MRFDLSVGPTVEPLTIADVESHCQMGTIIDDQKLAVNGMIVAARKWVENRIWRQCCTATWKAYLDGFPAEIQIRDKLPVQSVSSIQYTDENGDTQTLSSANYQVDCVSEDSPARIMPAYGCSWPTTRGSTYNTVTITFVAGYGGREDVPQPIKNAMLLLLADWHENRENSFIGSGATLQQIPYGVEACLSPCDWGAYA